MEIDITEIIKVVVLILSIISTIISTIAYFTKNDKVAKANQVVTKLKDLCVEAEQINPTNKKAYVLLGIKHACRELGVAYNEMYYSNMIDEFIALTKQINYKK